MKIGHKIVCDTGYCYTLARYAVHCYTLPPDTIVLEGKPLQLTPPPSRSVQYDAVVGQSTTRRIVYFMTPFCTLKQFAIFSGQGQIVHDNKVRG